MDDEPSPLKSFPDVHGKQGSVAAQSPSKGPKYSPHSMHDNPLSVSLHLPFHWLLPNLLHLDRGVHCHILPESQEPSGSSMPFDREKVFSEAGEAVVSPGTSANTNGWGNVRPG